MLRELNTGLLRHVNKARYSMSLDARIFIHLRLHPASTTAFLPSRETDAAYPSVQKREHRTHAYLNPTLHHLAVEEHYASPSSPPCCQRPLQNRPLCPGLSRSQYSTNRGRAKDREFERQGDRAACRKCPKLLSPHSLTLLGCVVDGLCYQAIC